MLNILRRVAGEKRAVGQLYEAIVSRSRNPVFYSDMGVADTFDGRFDLIVLHGWLVLEALRNAGLPDLEQRLLQQLFAAFEDGLRDQGAGDMSIGRRSKAMTSALFGRMKSYEAAASEHEMAEALIRNLYRDAPRREDCPRRMAHYITECRQALSQSPLSNGMANFAALPSAMETAT
jgi:cytochrome b pre-mRNA-processing protein 3